ncbi:MAG: stage V sporulation protein AC [Monoglobales bacterium]
MNKTEYSKLVKKESPGTKWYFNIPKAFIFGGFICLIGEAFRQFYLSMDMSDVVAGAFTAMTMVFIGAFLTGIGVYDNLAKHGGAGTAVPITGFANSIVSPAMEFKTDGFIMGVGAKMFTVAGPVIVYGVISSVIIGILHYLQSI